MKHFHIFLSLTVLFAMSVFTACGGSSGDISSSTATEKTDAFVSQYNSGLSAAGTGAGLTAAAVAESFDAAYLDAGFKKSDLLASLSANAQSINTNPDVSLFPTSNVSNGSVTNCDGNNICTFSGTLTNADADSTAVDFTTKVRVLNGSIYLYGDQSATTSI